MPKMFCYNLTICSSLFIVSVLTVKRQATNV